MKKTLFKADTIPFVMELPPYRVPTVRSVLKQTWFKGEQYLRKMGTIILAASVIIWALGYFPRGNDIDSEFAVKREQLNLSFQESLSDPTLSEADKELLLNAKRQIPEPTVKSPA